MAQGRDIYSRLVSFADPITADNVLVQFPIAGDLKNTGLLAQNVNLSYNQPVARVYDITSSDVLAIIGRADGSVQMAQVLGRKAVTDLFLKQFGDGCNMRTSHIDMTVRGRNVCTSADVADPGINAGNSVTWVAHYAVITSFSMGMQAGSGMVNQQYGLSISKLSKSDDV